eukprot:gb/GFBE01053754.1/.p1 GENE.gb/GFBE01053754.1/~~gb/GFBE01053754.1/.p1  ORF type:complete len:409 (+),score=73.90 gb/GFBE01053754.1/:1-1227(+)
MSQPSTGFKGLVTQDPGNGVHPQTIALEADCQNGPAPNGRPGHSGSGSGSGKSSSGLASRLLCCFIHGKHRPEPEEDAQAEAPAVQQLDNTAPPTKASGTNHAPKKEEPVQEVPDANEVVVTEQAKPAARSSGNPASGPSANPAQLLVTQAQVAPAPKPTSGQPNPPVSDGEAKDQPRQAPKPKSSPPAPAPSQPSQQRDVRPAQSSGQQRRQPEGPRYLLPPQEPKFNGCKTLVLDLDETLVHSSFTPVPCEMVLTLTLGTEQHKVYVKKRPGVDEFLMVVAQWYEVVIFTASTALYANALLDKLDTTQCITYRLFRDACSRYKEGYVKDLSRLGRNLDHVIIIDNLPICYALQPENAIPIKTWRDDPEDTELFELLQILVSLARVDEIPRVLQEILYDDGDDAEQQ